MGTTRWAAKKVAEELKEKGEAAITRSDAKKLVEERGNLSAPWRDHIRKGFERAGWGVSDGIFYLPDELSGEVDLLSKKLRSEGRVVISRSIVSQQTTNADYPRGEWGEVIDNAMKENGWKINEKDGLYSLPATELVTENSLAYYLMNSFTVPTEPESRA